LDLTNKIAISREVSEMFGSSYSYKLINYGSSLFIETIQSSHYPFKLLSNFSNSPSENTSLYNSCSCHKPLSLIFLFGEKLPNHLAEGLQLSQSDTVETSLDSQNSR